MAITYDAILYSKNILIDEALITLRYPAPVLPGMRLRYVDKLDKRATEKERHWYETQVLPCLVKEEK